LSRGTQKASVSGETTRLHCASLDHNSSTSVDIPSCCSLVPCLYVMVSGKWFVGFQITLVMQMSLKKMQRRMAREIMAAFGFCR
jgi:hypothetical protein